MSNLYKYIQTINESEDDDKKAEKYEKYIYIGFKYLKEKSQQQKRDTEKENLEIKNDLINSMDVNIDEKSMKDAANKLKVSELKVLIKKYRKSKQQTKEERNFIFSEIKNLVNEIIDLVDIDNTQGKTKFLKDLKNKLKQFDEDEILKKFKKHDNYNEEKNNDYKNVLHICRNFLKLKNHKENEISSVEHVGGQYENIHEYWRNLYPTDKQGLEIPKEVIGSLDKKGITSSVGKTDIVLEVGSTKYKFSVKHKIHQMATPTYVDIYILIMHGINVLLHKISTKNLIDNDMSKDMITEIQNEAEKIIQHLKTQRKKYIEKLKEEIQITDEKTNEYATDVSVTILIELLFKEINKEENEIKDLFDFNEKLETEKAKKILDTVVNKFKNLFIDVTINSEDRLKLLEDVNIDDIKNIENEIKKEEALRQRLIEKQNEQRKVIKLQSSEIPKNIDSLKEEIKLILDKFKKLTGKRLNKLKLKGDEYNKTFEAIKRLLYSTNGSPPSKEKEYNLIFTLKDSALKANKQFQDFFAEENNNIFKIIETQNDKFINFINKNKKTIINEILKEAITGLYKFTGSDNYNNTNKYVPNYIFEFDHRDKNYLKIKPIDSESNLNAFIITILKEKFNFSIKGSGSHSYIALRITADFKKMFKYISSKFSLKNPFRNSIIRHDNSYNEFNYEYDIYTEGFIENLTDKAKEKINDTFNSFKIKFLKASISLKNKTGKLFRLLGLQIKVDKNMKLPSWIVDKL